MTEFFKEKESYPPAELYRVGEVVGMYYSCGTETDKVVMSVAAAKKIEVELG